MDSLKAFVIADEDVAMLLRADLDNDDIPVPFRWDGASTLRAALDHLPQSRTDIILLQTDLPDSSGMETLRAVRSLAPGVPVIVLGNIDDLKTALRAIQEGAQDVLLAEDDDVFGMARRIRFAIEREAIRRVTTTPELEATA